MKLIHEDRVSIEDLESLPKCAPILKQKEELLIEFLKRAPAGTQIKISPKLTLWFLEINGKRTVCEVKNK